MENTILSFLFHSTLLFSILFAGIWLIKKAFSRHLSALLQYVLWIVVIIKLLLPVGLPSELSPWNLFQWSGGAEEIQQTAQAEALEEYRPVGMQGEPFQNTAGMEGSVAQEQSSAQDSTQSEGKVGSGSNSINWYYTAVYVWAAGMLAMLGWLIICAAQIKWKIALNKAGPVPDWTLRIFEECKKELGIKKDVGLVVQHIFPIPAITGVLKPILILPVQTLSGKDAGQMKHILMHELTHYKSGDIIATTILNILNAVYWFNPLVWLCCKLIRKDMEILCDTRVIGRLGKENRQEYIHTILMFSQLKHTPGLNPAMSLNDGCVTMQKRILGMFGRKKTKARIKVPVLLICMAIVFSCFTTACQTAPEKKPVAGRVELEKKVEQAAAPVVKYEAPGNWQETLELQGSKVKVDINAALTLPDVEAYPVYKVQKADFTQNQIDKLLAFFLKDKKVLKNPVMTKAEYETQIVETERGQLADGEYVVTDESEAWVEELEKMMQEAPETNEMEYITDFNLKSGAPTFGIVELGNGKYGNISFSDNVFVFTNGGYLEPESQIFSLGKKAIGGTFKITEEEAAAVAQSVLDKLGVTDMTPESIEKARFYPQTSIDGMMQTEPESKGYYIKYVREIDGIKNGLIESWSFSENDKYTYSPPWEAETIQVYLDEEGNMQYIYWVRPLKVTEKMSDNADLMPFAEMQDRMRNQLKYSLSFMEEYKNLSVTVDRIELKMAMINIQDNPDEAMYVPAWYIHYTLHSRIDYTDDNGNDHTEEIEDEQLMILDAIDGGSVSTASAAILSKINAATEARPQEAQQMDAEPVAVPVSAETVQEAQ